MKDKALFFIDNIVLINIIYFVLYGLEIFRLFFWEIGKIQDSL